MAAANAYLQQLDAEERHQLEAWLLEFDQSWHESQLAERARRLPPCDSPLRFPTLVELVKIDLERQWCLGRRPCVEDYLQVYPELGTAETVTSDLIQSEYEVRRQFGASADLAEFRQRFPCQADELLHLLEQMSEVVSDSELAHASQATPRPTPSTYGSRRGRAAAAGLPEQFGRYRIMRKLGQGGMGAVFLAHDTQLDRPVALKVPSFAPEEGPEVLERFYREARAAATLDHPNICPIHDVGEIDGIPYLTMAYVPGQSLSAFIDPNRPMPQGKVATIVHKLALALEEAHKRGVIHRDLKPSNIMVNQRSDVVIMDFGLARRVNKEEARLTHEGSILGTPAYMSPEQINGKLELMGPNCDIYSLGVILYELLAGRLPFEGSGWAVVAQILTASPPQPSSLRPDTDPCLEAICSKAMARELGERFASMEALAAALAAFLQSSPAPAGPPLAPSPTAARTPGLQAAAASLRRHWRRRSFLAAEGAAALVLAGIVLFVTTQYGTVRIELSDPHANVEVRVDGTSIEVAGLDQPLRLRVGERQLLVTGKDFETVSESFTVKRGGNPVCQIQLVPKGSDRKSTPAGESAEKGAPAEQGSMAIREVTKDLPREITNSIGMKLVLIPAGGFDMGSHESVPDLLKAFPGTRPGSFAVEFPQRRQTISWPFYLGVFEVTQAEYERVMGTNPSAFSARGPGLEVIAGLDSSRFPVETVSWQNAVHFCNRLSALPEEKRVGRRYRLPSEVEWEYACRGGSQTSTRYGFGNAPADLGKYAWHQENSGGRPHPVGERAPNGFGLHDLHGNVAEWCSEPVAADYAGEGLPDSNGKGAATRRLRGGAYGFPAVGCRSSAVERPPAAFSGGDMVGFRVVLYLEAGADRGITLAQASIGRPSLPKGDEEPPPALSAKPPQVNEKQGQVEDVRMAFEAALKEYDRRELEAEGGPVWQKLLNLRAAAQEAARQGQAVEAATKYKEAQALLPEVLRTAQLPRAKYWALSLGAKLFHWADNQQVLENATDLRDLELARKNVPAIAFNIRRLADKLQIRRASLEALLKTATARPEDFNERAGALVREVIVTWGDQVFECLALGEQMARLRKCLTWESRKPKSVPNFASLAERLRSNAQDRAYKAGFPQAMIDHLNDIKTKVGAGTIKEAAESIAQFPGLKDEEAAVKFLRQPPAKAP